MKQSFFRFLLFFSLVFAFSACKKADPNPELKDPLYLLNQNETAAAKAEVAAAEAAILEAEAQIQKAVPQTGQIKYAQKRYWDARNKLALAKQKVQYFETRAQLQMWDTREKSLEAFFQDKSYSNKEEFESYELQNKLDHSSRNWDVKKRRAALGLPTGRDPASLPEAPKAASVEGGGGGH